MAMIENILNSTEASDLDKLLQSFEFDNKQYVKLIEKENQQIEAYMKETEVKQNNLMQLQLLISKLDDDTKRSHRQFTQNRENCESLRKTTVVLMEHEVALHKKLTSIYSTGENDRSERAGVLQHYRNIWEDYSATYKRFPLAIKLQKKQDEFGVLSQQVESARQQADQLKEKITLAQDDEADEMESDIALLNTNNNEEIGMETDKTIQPMEGQDSQLLKEKESSTQREEANGETDRQPMEVTAVNPNQSLNRRGNNRTNSSGSTTLTSVPTIPSINQNAKSSPSPSSNISKTPTIRPHSDHDNNQQRFNNMQITPRPRTPIILTPRIPNLLAPRPPRHQGTGRPHYPLTMMQETRGLRSFSPQILRSPMIRSQIPNIQSPVRQTVIQNKSPQVTEKKKTPTVTNSPKTPKNSSANSSSSNSPFDLDKHLEKMQNLKKSPGFMPLKSRAMFDNQGDCVISSPAAGFLQTFNQNNKMTAEAQATGRPEFNMSLFSNISSPETANSSVFSFGVDSMTAEPGSDTANSFMGFFEGSGSNNDKEDTSGFSFNFSGNDTGAKSPESTEGFTFNFGGSSEQQPSSVFSLF
ncbi:hypothetical protein LOTGIDRAFT_229018 [Lottia gigantea]|uniref:Uncharacterized protein n=1 Tax=Lottia gigantea TaxID=225164 RepID=V3ZXH6_LOTGI|nr:hypothetical protein LOTGIDRAFT_229018 [Lottia gigantea]ESO89092.1 hypothetical protein LOTGIDRAFT_229018 [Lottia gigantea]